MNMRFLIIDGYPRVSREQFASVGMTVAGMLYANLLHRYLPGARYDLLYSSDPGVTLPDLEGVKKYHGILWPGCNLTVYHDHDERVTKILDLVDAAFTAVFQNILGRSSAVSPNRR